MQIQHIINNLSDNSFSHDIVIKDCIESLNSILFKFNSKYYDYNLEMFENELYFYATDENQAHEILDNIKKHYQILVNQI
jgi:hypothetical protein